MRNSILLIIALFSTLIASFGQDALVEGYVFEDGGRGYLNQVKVNFFDAGTDDFLEQVLSDKDGFFSLKLPKNRKFRIEAYKDIFEPVTQEIETTDDEKLFVKLVMKREDGYLFEVTLAPKRESEDIAVDAIKGALIEVYNNTTQEEVLVLENHPSPDFKIQFKKGNHYTIMVRKEGYLVKRMEAYVNVEGCILCFEGVGEVRPGVTENLTEGLTMGTLLANVELEPIYEGKIIELQNINYAFGSADLTKQAREELKKLANILEDNQHLTVELGSHTDVRGTGPDNRALSDRRAKSAVDYLTKEQKVRKDRIVAIGYGESQIKNKCLPGVTCTEEEHAENRRTEIKVLNIDQDSQPLKSLASMKVEEEFMRKILEGEVEQIKVGERESNEDLKDSTSNLVENEDVNMGIEKEEEIEEMIGNAVVDTITKLQVQSEPVKIKDSVLLSEGAEEVVAIQAQESVEESSEIRDDPNEFTGYRIVVHFSNFPISGDHEIYQKFDDVEEYTTTQKYILYMIGEFATMEAAESFRKEKVGEDLPNSYTVGFLNGKKITIE